MCGNTWLAKLVCGGVSAYSFALRVSCTLVHPDSRWLTFSFGPNVIWWTISRLTSDQLVSTVSALCFDSVSNESHGQMANDMMKFWAMSERGPNEATCSGAVVNPKRLLLALVAYLAVLKEQWSLIKELAAFPWMVHHSLVQGCHPNPNETHTNIA